MFQNVSKCFSDKRTHDEKQSNLIEGCLRMGKVLKGRQWRSRGFARNDQLQLINVLTQTAFAIHFPLFYFHNVLILLLNNFPFLKKNLLIFLYLTRVLCARLVVRKTQRISLNKFCYYKTVCLLCIEFFWLEMLDWLKIEHWWRLLELLYCRLCRWIYVRVEII